ncbi:MAG: NADH-quinone oxidoreductase subunit M [Chitinophagaceae bacterium]|nr:NADH-quinone oxidoreductase subunit M [Chitinophagaceae bacterium]
MNLSLLIIVPLILAVAGLLVNNQKQVKLIALASGIAQLVLACCLAFLFIEQRKTDRTTFLFQQQYEWFSNLNIGYFVGVDGISVAMILLTAFIVLAGILISWNVKRMSKEYFFLMQVLAIGAYGFFISLDLFTLFFFLELAVVPKFMLIGIWGSGKKEYSAMKLALMLMAASALVFVGITGLYYFSTTHGVHHFNLLMVADNPLPLDKQKVFFPFAFIGFGIFTALFPFHTWVPDGHSSAPTAASMFLAGISMKLGGYGCLRVAVYLMPDGAQFYSNAIIVLACIAVLYGAFVTMMQTDLKYINAYSSVSHCGFVLLGIGMLTKTAVNGAVLQMISHGLMTALFFAVIGMIYERTHTRQVSKMGGLLKIMPFISTIFVIVGLCSLGLPGLSGFVAEMTVFVGSWQRAGWYYQWATILAAASIVVTAVYILRATAKVIMGPVKINNSTGDAAITELYGKANPYWNERAAVYLLAAGIFIMGIAPFVVTDIIYPATDFIMQKLSFK